MFGTSAKKRRLLKAQEGKWPGPSLATSLSHCCCRFCWWFCQGKLLPQTCDRSWMAYLKYAHTLSPISHNHGSVENWAPKWSRKRSYWRYAPFSTKNHDYGEVSEGQMNFSVGSHATGLQICPQSPSSSHCPDVAVGGSVSVLVSLNLKQAKRHPGDHCPHRKISFGKRTKTSLGTAKLLDIWIYTWILWLNLDEW